MTTASQCFASYSIFRSKLENKLSWRHVALEGSAPTSRLRGPSATGGTSSHRSLSFRTSSAAQGGGGSFKNRKPIGEVGCCESGMAERSH